MKKYCAAILMFAATPVYAGVGKVSSPNITKGETEIEYSAARYADNDRDLNNKQGHSYELKYSLTDRFMMGLEAKSRRDADDGHEFEGYGGEMQYQINKQNEAWLSTAIKAEYLRTPDASPDELQLKLIAARDYGKTRITANAAMAHEFGDDRKTGLSFNSALQARYTINPYAAPALEWHADYGKGRDFNDLDQQEHYIGPAMVGRLWKRDQHEINYGIGYYWGLTNRSANNAARVQLGYSFPL